MTCKLLQWSNHLFGIVGKTVNLIDVLFSFIREAPQKAPGKLVNVGQAACVCNDNSVNKMIEQVGLPELFL